MKTYIIGKSSTKPLWSGSINESCTLMALAFQKHWPLNGTGPLVSMSIFLNYSLEKIKILWLQPFMGEVMFWKRHFVYDLSVLWFLVATTFLKRCDFLSQSCLFIYVAIYFFCHHELYIYVEFVFINYKLVDIWLQCNR